MFGLKYNVDDPLTILNDPIVSTSLYQNPWFNLVEDQAKSISYGARNNILSSGSNIYVEVSNIRYIYEILQLSFLFSKL
jgi:hypothetical protein